MGGIVFIRFLGYGVFFSVRYERFGKFVLLYRSEAALYHGDHVLYDIRVELHAL